MQRSKQVTGDKRRLLNIHAVARDLGVDVLPSQPCTHLLVAILPARSYEMGK